MAKGWPEAGPHPPPAEGRPKIGLALAGGGPEGAIYHIGALRALEEAFEGLDLNQLFIYVGVSAGAFIAACLANDLTAAQMSRAIVSREPGEHPFIPETFLTPAVGQLWRSGKAMPRLVAEALWDYVSNETGRSFLSSLTGLARALPVGLFDNEPIRRYLEKIYNIKGRTDDFRRLGKRLVVVAADLDAGREVCFGEPGFDHVPISLAVAASSALPGLYSPVEIEGRHYVDGVLLKTLHASVALEAGAELLICVNPIVPVDTVHAVEAGLMSRPNLVDRGLPAVLSQTLRTIIRSRLEVGMAAYRTRFASSDVVLLEPAADDYRMFFTNIFGFAERRDVCDHAYRSTRRHLLARYDTLAPVLARHGVTLRRQVLEDQDRTLWESAGRGRSARPAAAAATIPLVSRLDHALARLDETLDRLHPAGIPEGQDQAPRSAGPMLAGDPGRGPR